MFDRIMENSTALWLLISAAYPIFLVSMVVRAVRHYRRTRHPLAYPASIAYPAASPSGKAREDWTAAR
jgi:hypothetical protein